ncbi:hypothetical protein ADUPG1_008768, partial [Aduncisulcus paluster]
ISIPTLTFSSPSLDKSHIFSVLRDLILGKIHLKCSRPTLLTIDSQLKKTSIISGDPIHEIDSIFCKYSLSLFSFPLSPSSSFLSTSSKAKDEPIFQKSHSIPPLSTFLTLTPLHLIPATSLPICFLNGPYQLLWTDKESSLPSIHAQKSIDTSEQSTLHQTDPFIVEDCLKSLSQYLQDHSQVILTHFTIKTDHKTLSKRISAPSKPIDDGLCVIIPMGGSLCVCGLSECMWSIPGVKDVTRDAPDPFEEDFRDPMKEETREKKNMCRSVDASKISKGADIDLSKCKVKDILKGDEESPLRLHDHSMLDISDHISSVDDQIGEMTIQQSSPGDHKLSSEIVGIISQYRISPFNPFSLLLLACQGYSHDTASDDVATLSHSDSFEYKQSRPSFPYDDDHEKISNQSSEHGSSSASSLPLSVGGKRRSITSSSQKGGWKGYFGERTKRVRFSDGPHPERK